MPLIEWTDEMAVRIASIDQQHKKLLKLLNDLNEAMLNGQNQQMLSQVITELVDYIYYHFMTEEKYFDQYGYPEAAGHKEEHRYFVREVEDFQKRLENNERQLTGDIILFLKSWVHNHIQKKDQKYGPFLLSRGVR